MKIGYGCGFRHFDTAHLHNNENIIGELLQECVKDKSGLLENKKKNTDEKDGISTPDVPKTGEESLTSSEFEKTKEAIDKERDQEIRNPLDDNIVIESREELFLTSKFLGHSKQTALASCEQSLQKLQCKYLDLFLIQWPGGALPEERYETWSGMKQLYSQKKCRAIGVSNFEQRHLEPILIRERKEDSVHRVFPMVNQFESHPRLIRKDLREFCQKNQIVVMASMSLGTGVLTRNKVVERISAQYPERDAGQILLRWHLHHQGIPVVKSTHPDRLNRNINIFDFALSPTDISDLDALDSGTHFDWDSSVIKY
eukprot:TRINITY_DN11831_c0_g1_i1.p1 TRINITY_DN11831_c0_g1~~TRINITY_DN11831_c0_g1_i1.p1  ORF type:complete len:313 (-),score=35.54 TRINITY_DN11831_c0_g1_i1:338-1276(-)